MSIFSSWLAAPNSGVITYIGTSTSGTIAASPWPMPEVSTTIRSKPAALQAASTSGSAWLISLPESRVARLRMKTRWPCCHGPIAFMRMRSPSSAPPLLRRDGSMLMTAMRSASSWSSRRRRISSSVRLDLPAPPVPVMPSTGTRLRLPPRPAARPSARPAALPLSSAVISCASARQAASPWPWIAASVRRRVRRQVVVAAHHHLADHPGQAHALAVLGAVDARHAVGLQLADLGRHDHAAAAAEDLDVRAAALRSRSTMYLKYSTWPPW